MHSEHVPALQLALDIGDPAGLLRVAREVAYHVDWIEAGTPLILAQGTPIVETLHAEFPEKPIVADMKIMDGGYYEATLAFAAGAAIVTVLGVASDATVRGAVKAAREQGGRVMVDLLQVFDLVERARNLTELGVDYLCVHTAYDLRDTGVSPVQHLEILANAGVAPLVVAGGLSLHNVTQVLPYDPAAVVVGGAITRAPEPVVVADAIRRALARGWTGEELP